MRAYLRLDPHLADKKAEYPDGAHRAFVDTLCFAEHQPMRGRFRNQKLLAVLLEKRARWIPYLIEHGDLVPMPDGKLYVDGWDEWQEGDWKVHERVSMIRHRRDPDAPAPTSGAQRTANWRLRTKVFERDDFTCRYCGVTDYPRDWLVLEHVIPDGPTAEENLVTACRPCNKRKGGMTPEQAGMVLRDVSPRRDVTHHANGVTPHSVSGSGKQESGGGASPRQTFMGYRPKRGEHVGQHPDCSVCAPLRKPAA
jgi:5-methylcytosine-specific restriction endonuclease McrA